MVGTDFTNLSNGDKIVVMITENEPGLWQDSYPVPSTKGHKYSRGHAIVLSGGIADTGAARLAAKAALRAGAGLVTLYSPPAALFVNACQLTSVMVKPIDGVEALVDALDEPRISSVILGPALGVGLATRKKVRAVLSSGKHAVLDADALTSFADDREELFQAIASTGAKVVITPHEGEFCSLFGGKSPMSDVERNKRVVVAAETSGAIVVLKGPQTLVCGVAGSGGPKVIRNTNAPPWLATAGSGDVLAGIIGGLLAQGMSPLDAASAGVWLHGEAGNICGPGLIAEDLDEGLRQAVKALVSAHSLRQ